MPHRLNPFVQRSLAIIGLALLIASGSATPGEAKSRTVSATFVLLCDIYELSEIHGRGGYARLAGAVNAVRARSSNVFVVHAGDAISPSLMSGFDKGEHTIDLLNRIGLDAFVPGNHEYDFGKDVFLQRMGEARFPLLAANLRDAEGNIVPGFADTKMLDVDGVKIGVVGLTLEESRSKSSPGDLKFASSLETVKSKARHLREAGAAIIVAIAHADLRRDRKLLNTGVIDVLLSGHDHDLVVYYDGEHAWAESKQDGQYVVSVELRISVDENNGKQKVSWWPRFDILDTADVSPDPVITRVVANYEAQLSKELDVALGKTSTDMTSAKSAVRSQETAIGNLITDAMRAATGADIAIFNGGGIRGNTNYPAGSELTRRAVLSELPFGNKTVVLEMTGHDILATLENGYWYAGKSEGRFAQVSGLSVVVDTSRRPGQKIQMLEIGGAPVDPVRLYKVATNDFLARGSEGYDKLASAKVLIGPEEGTLVVNDVMVFIRKAGTVSPRVEGRIRLTAP